MSTRTGTFDLSERTSRQSSLFSTGRLCRFLQPFFLQEGANLWFSITSWESVRIIALETLRDFAFSRMYLNALMHARSSILLLVVRS